MEKFTSYLNENNKTEIASELEIYSYQVLSEIVYILRKENNINTDFEIEGASSLNILILKKYLEDRNKESINSYKVLLTNSTSSLIEYRRYDLILLSNIGKESKYLKNEYKSFHSLHTNMTYLLKKKNQKNYNFVNDYFNRLNDTYFTINSDILNDYYSLFLEKEIFFDKKEAYEKENMILKNEVENTREENEKKSKENDFLIQKNNNIKKQLSYRVGSLLVSSVKNKDKLRSLPIDMLSEINDFYNDKNVQPKVIHISKKIASNLGWLRKGEKLEGIKKLDVIINSTKSKFNSKKNIGYDLKNNALKDFVDNYENIRISYFISSDLKGLYNITHDFLKNNPDSFLVFEPILKEVLQILFYYEDASSIKVEKELVRYFLEYYLINNKLGKISKFFVEFSSTLGWTDFKEIIEKNKVDFADIYKTQSFLEAVILKPQAIVVFLDDDFYNWAVSQDENYELVLVKFIYTIIKNKLLEDSVLLGFFNINKTRYKKRFLDVMQRYTYTIKRSIGNDKIICDLIEKVDCYEDLVYVSLLISCHSNIMTIESFISKVYQLNKKILLDDYQLAYFLSQTGNNNKLTDIINNSFKRSEILPISHIGNNSIENIYNSILKVDTDKNVSINLPMGLINVITSTFNPDISLLSLSIDSILQQSHSTLLLTIVDDCSDNGKDIKQLINEKNDKRINYLRMPENGGVYKCRNLAISSIESDFIAFQDDDDVSHPQRLEYQLSHLRNNDIDISMVTNLRIDIDGHVQIDNHNSILSNGPVTMLFSKDLISKVGFFKEFRSRGDVEFKNRCVRLLGPSSLEVDSKILYYSLGSHNSLSSTFEHGKNNSNLKLIRSLIHYDQTKRNDNLEIQRNSDSKITVCMSSFPARKEKMLLTIDSVIESVDKLYLYLNNYKEIPVELNKYNNLEVILGENAEGDLRDNGKIYPFSVQDIKGYCFLIDDDIIYPASYFNEYIRKIEKYNRKVVVGVHGVIFTKPFQSYFKNRKVYHFKNENLTDVIVHQLGTGALAFHTDILTPTLSKYMETGMADVFFAIEAKQLEIPLICIAHPAGWLKPLDIEIEDTSNLYDEFKHDHSKQTMFIKNAGEFRELNIYDI